MNEKLISIIVPIYNSAQFLRDCIESARNQTYKNIEIVLVNDGSTDGSGGICDEYATKDDRILVIHQENQGRVTARNQGLASSHGEFITFLDSDDWIAEEHCAYLMDCMIQHQVDLVSCGFTYEYPTYSEKIRQKAETGVYTFEEDGKGCILDLLPDEKSSYPRIYSGLCCKLLKKESIIKPLLECPKEIVRCEDWFQLVCVFSHIKSLYISEETFYHYRIHGANTVLNQNINASEGWRLGYDFVKGYYQNHGYYDRVMKSAKIYHQVYNVSFFSAYLHPDVVPSLRKERLNPSVFSESKKVVIYGMGQFGERYYRDLLQLTPHKVVALIDKNKSGTFFEGIEIQNPSILQGFSYEKLLIAVLSETVAEEIRKELISLYHVPQEKICWEKPVSMEKFLFDS